MKRMLLGAGLAAAVLLLSAPASAQSWNSNKDRDSNSWGSSSGSSFGSQQRNSFGTQRERNNYGGFRSNRSPQTENDRYGKPLLYGGSRGQRSGGGYGQPLLGGGRQ